MEIKEIQLKETEVIIDVICDICGNSCNTELGMEYMSLSAHWGFMSNKDLETWTAQICEKCVDEHLNFINFNKK